MPTVNTRDALGVWEHRIVQDALIVKSGCDSKLKRGKILISTGLYIAYGISLKILISAGLYIAYGFSNANGD